MRYCPGGISNSLKESDEISKNSGYSTMVTAGTHRCHGDVVGITVMS